MPREDLIQEVRVGYYRAGQSTSQAGEGVGRGRSGKLDTGTDRKGIEAERGHLANPLCKAHQSPYRNVHVCISSKLAKRICSLSLSLCFSLDFVPEFTSHKVLDFVRSIDGIFWSDLFLHPLSYIKVLYRDYFVILSTHFYNPLIHTWIITSGK